MKRGKDLAMEVDKNALEGASQHWLICRTCMNYTLNPHVVNKTVIGITIAQMLNMCIPEVYLGVSKAPVICNSCLGCLTAAFRFRKTCLGSEKKIKNYLTHTRKSHTQIELEEVLNFAREDQAKQKGAEEAQKHKNPFQFKISSVVSLRATDSSSEVVPATDSTEQTSQQEIKSVTQHNSALTLTKATQLDKNKITNVKNASDLNSSSYNIQPIVLHTTPAPQLKNANAIPSKLANVNPNQQKLTLLQTDNGQLLLGYLLPGKGQHAQQNSTTATASTTTASEPVSTSNSQPVVLNRLVSDCKPFACNANAKSGIPSLTLTSKNAKIVTAPTCSTSSKLASNLKSDSNGAMFQGLPILDVVRGSSQESTSSTVTVKKEPQSSVDQVPSENIPHPRALVKPLCNIKTLSPSMEPPSDTLAGDSSIPPLIYPANAENNNHPTLMPLYKFLESGVQASKNMQRDPLALDTSMKQSANAPVAVKKYSRKGARKPSLLRTHLETSSKTTDTQSTSEMPLMPVIKQEPPEFADTPPVTPSSDPILQNENLNIGIVPPVMPNHQNNKNNANSASGDVNRTLVCSENASDPLLDRIKEEPQELATDGVGSVETEACSLDDRLHDLLKDMPAMEREDIPEYISIKRIDHQFYAPQNRDTCQPPCEDDQLPSSSQQPPNSAPRESSNVTKIKTYSNKHKTLKRKSGLAPKHTKKKRPHQLSCFWRDGIFVCDHDYSMLMPSQYAPSNSWVIGKQVLPLPPLAALSPSASSGQVDEGNRVYKFHCYICSFETGNPLEEQTHMNSHTLVDGKDGVLRCRACSADFLSAYELSRHCIIHCELCQLCGRTLQSWQVPSHQRAHQRESKAARDADPTSTKTEPRRGGRYTRRHGCGVCWMKFYQKKDLSLHLIDHQMNMLVCRETLQQEEQPLAQAST